MKKKILLIFILVSLFIIIFYGISIFTSKEMVKNFINIKYDELNYDNFSERYQEQNQYIIDEKEITINPFPEEVAQRFESEHTYVKVEDCEIKITKLVNSVRVNAIYKTVIQSEINEEFEQIIHYNVDYVLKRKGLFKFEIYDIVKKSVVSVLSTEEHSHDDN